MKKLFIILITFIQSSLLQAQCLSNGIKTNPNSPINNQLPSKTNLYFNWTQSNWQNNSSCEPLNTIESPFFKIDNLEILRASKDMQPQDGWELIRREFGYTDQNTLKPQTPEHTYFILYNKYTGILRILLKVCRTGADYNGAKISIKFDATSSFQSSLLDLAVSSNAKPIDQPHIQNPIGQSASIFVNDKTKWFYADFPMTYDPCTCIYASKLNIVSQLIQNSQISLQGSLTGTITSISNGQGNVNGNGSYSFKDFVNDADKFKKGYSSVDNFINETKNVAATIPNSTGIINALTNLQSGLKNDQFLKLGLASVPWLKSASGLLDFFSGGGKTSPQTVQLMPMAVNLNMKLAGTMTTANQYHDIKFSNPGTLNAQNDPDIYPFYNEILGVFNFINGPKGTYTHFTPERGGNYFKFKLTEPIKWVLNPASDLQLQDAQVAYVADFMLTGANNSNPPPTSVGQGFDFLEGKNAETNLWTYRTEYVDIDCFNINSSFRFDYIAAQQKYPSNRKVYLKFILNLKRVSNPAAQNVLLILKYPIKWGTGSYANEVPFNPSNCISGGILQASNAEITSFCNSSTYTTNRFMRQVPIYETLDTNINELTIKVGPNPVVDNQLYIQGSSVTDITRIQIIDLTGRLVYDFAEKLKGTFKKVYQVPLLASGLYTMKAIDKKGNSKGYKILVKK